MALPRREFLLSSAAALSGCSALSTEPTPTERPDSDGDGVDDYPENPGLPVEQCRGNAHRRPGRFQRLSVTRARQRGENHLRYEASVVGDGTVDVVVFERAAYDAYADGARDVSVVDRYTRTDVTEASVRDEVGERELLLAVDNTDLLTPATDRPLGVEFLLEIVEPSDTGE